MSQSSIEFASRWCLGGEALAALALRANVALLLMGIFCFVGGILLLLQHRREWLASLAERSDARTRRFEEQKFRRRALLTGMISSAGCLMTSMYWLVEPRLWATMMGVLLLVLLGIVGLAVIDLFSVGLREMTEPNPESQREMIRKCLELREKRRREQAAGESEPESAAPASEQPNEP